MQGAGSDWEADVSTYNPDVGGGVYFDPRTGKYYADIGYTYKKKVGIGDGWKLGQEKGRSGRDVIELDASELEDFYKWRQTGAGSRYRGKRGRDAYQGPGRALADTVVYDKDGLTLSTGLFSGWSKSQGEKDEAARRKQSKKDQSWWDRERLSGERGQKRIGILKSRREAIEAYRTAAQRQGWGATPNNK